MKNFKISVVVGAALSLLIVSPAFALEMGLGASANAGVRVGSTTVKASAAARLETKMSAAKDRVNQEIDRRVAALNDFNTKVQAMVRLSDEEKTSMEKFIHDQITALSTLKAKIAADADIDALKSDIKSVTENYRIFMLVIPQAHITVASDKILSTAEKFTALELKLATRIAAKKLGGNDVTSFEAVDVDMKTKLTDASAQASAATAIVVTLTPDNGDQAKAAANKKALQDARAKIKAGLQALNDARKDAAQIISGLKGVAVQAESTTSTAVTH